MMLLKPYMVKNFVKHFVEFEKDWKIPVEMLLMMMVRLDELALLDDQVLVVGCKIMTRVVAAMVEKLGNVKLVMVCWMQKKFEIAKRDSKSSVVLVGTVKIGMTLTKENMVFVYTAVDNIVVSIVGNVVVVDIGTRKEKIVVGVGEVVGVFEVVVPVVDIGGIVVQRMLVEVVVVPVVGTGGIAGGVVFVERMLG